MMASAEEGAISDGSSVDTAARSSRMRPIGRGASAIPASFTTAGASDDRRSERKPSRDAYRAMSQVPSARSYALFEMVRGLFSKT